MGSNFDLLEKSMMDVVTNQFGYSASWTPSGGGPAQVALVLLNAPTKKQQVQAMNFEGDVNYSMEYRDGIFPGLIDSVRNTRNKEQVTIDGALYNCRFVKAKYEGKTNVITLELPE